MIIRAYVFTPTHSVSMHMKKVREGREGEREKQTTRQTKTKTYAESVGYPGFPYKDLILSLYLVFSSLDLGMGNLSRCVPTISTGE